MQRDRYMTDIRLERDPKAGCDVYSEILQRIKKSDFVDWCEKNGLRTTDSFVGPYLIVGRTWLFYKDSEKRKTQFTLPIYENHDDVYLSVNETILLSTIAELGKDNDNLWSSAKTKDIMIESLLRSLTLKEAEDAEAD